MTEVALSQGLKALVDDSDAPRILPLRWCAQRIGKTYYAARYEKGKYLYMHRVIMNPPPGLEVDHIDHDGLNNRRKNLRIVTRQENLLNIGSVNVPKTSAFRGVHRRGKKWIAMASVNNKTVYLGSFESEEDAAMAYERCRGKKRPERD